MKNRVGIFSLAYSPFVGGAEIAVQEITKRLSDRDFFVFTNRFDSRWPQAERDGNVAIIRLGKGSAGSSYYGRFSEKIAYVFRAWRAAERSHKEKPFRAIWVVMASYAGFAALLFKLRHPKVPMLLTLQEGDSETHILGRVGVFYPLWKLIFKRSDFIQAISSYLADFGRRHGARCPIEVVPNGVSLDKIINIKSKSKNDDKKIIITTSRLVHKNGVDTLIRAVAKLSLADWRLMILGSGPDEAMLKNLAQDLGVAERVQFLGHVDPEKISGYLAEADIFVRASRSEGLGNSFLEAMAAGIPVIGTNVGGIPDFLKDRETGLFVKVDDPKDLAEKITLLLTDIDLARMISENGKRLVEENYTWDKIAGRMNSIFSNLTNNSQLKPVNLLVATGIYPPDIGGPATYTVLLEEELPSRGFFVDHLAFTNFRKLPKLIRHIGYFWSCFWKAGSFDFVYAQDPVSVGLPALIAARLRGKKFFIRVAGDYAWEQSAQRFGVKETIDDFQKKKYGWKVELLRKAQKFVVGRADLVITPSKYFQKLVGGWIKNPERVKTIYNGLKFEEGLELKKIGTGKSIVTAGRLVPWKGFDVLINLMNDLPDWELTIIGDGPDMGSLNLLVKRHKLEERIHLVGSVSREEVFKIYQQAELFILNTSFESFSFQVVEAMSVGLPVIVTNVGSLPELVDDGQQGILVEPNNKIQILDAIKKIDSDKNFREVLSKNAKEKARQFSISRTVDNLVNLINLSR